VSCHRPTTSGLESSRSQDTKGAEQLLVSPTRLLGLPEVTGLGCAVENFGEAALLRSVLVALRSGEAKVSSASWPSGRFDRLCGVAVDGLSDTAAAECIEELGVLKRLLKACSEDCAWSVSITIT